jgi:hypothetical protein
MTPNSEVGLKVQEALFPDEGDRSPIPASTYTAHVVTLYTNASGKYVATAQQPRSHFLAQDFVRLRKGVGGGEGDDDEDLGIFLLGGIRIR